MSARVSNIMSLSGAGESSISNHLSISQGKSRSEDAPNREAVSKEAVKHTVEAIEDYVETHQNSLRIQVHEGTGEIVVKVISEKDGKTIREIPSEELLNLAAKMERLEGMLINESV